MAAAGPCLPGKNDDIREKRREELAFEEGGLYG